MKKYVFRNTTIEPFFSKEEYDLSGYDDITVDYGSYETFVWCYLLPVSVNKEAQAEYISTLYQKFEYLCSVLPSDKSIVAFTLEELVPFNLERSNFLGSTVLASYNEKISRLTGTYSNLKLINFSAFLKNYDVQSLVDWKYYHLSMIQLNPKLASDFKNWMKREIEILTMTRRKCLVLDLDNTLWGGILGEDGIGGIRIGGDYPGNAFTLFQEMILELKKSGVILAVCSKNNESDVLTAWKKNDDILIKKEHLAAYRINWNNKADNIFQLSKELNIGLDSIVFIDDNPAEREHVRMSLPEVGVPDFPKHPYELFDFGNEVMNDYFAAYRLTIEDRVKTEQYQQNKMRSELANKFDNNEDFLKSLSITISLVKLDEVTVQRFSQLCNKTNQFNFTTKRYTEEDLRSLQNKGAMIKGLRVRDKFGDYGITGLFIGQIAHSNEAIIDSFLLSCRVLGKGVEYAFLHAIFEKLRKRGVERLKGIYLPTDKNIHVKPFYDDIGFSLIQEKDSGSRYYTLDLNNNPPKLSGLNYVTIEE